jgi:hypothetical protein
VFALLAVGLAVMNAACPPTSEKCTNSIIALVVLSIPWSALFAFLAAVLLGLISLPAVMFHVNYSINLVAIPQLLGILVVIGLLWGGVRANVVLLYRFAIAQEGTSPRDAEGPPGRHPSTAPGVATPYHEDD